MNKSLETLFDHLGCLYKFHQRPMTYLYNTLHYYEDRLRDRAALRKKIVASITDALKEVLLHSSLLKPILHYSSGSTCWLGSHSGDSGEIPLC